MLANAAHRQAMVYAFARFDIASATRHALRLACIGGCAMVLIAAGQPLPI